MSNNYILRLQDENKELTGRIDKGVEHIRRIRGFLQSAEKFIQRDPKGERKDWISTGDMDALLVELEATLKEGA